LQVRPKFTQIRIFGLYGIWQPGHSQQQLDEKMRFGVCGLDRILKTPRKVSEACPAAYQGCQICLGPNTPNGKNITK
jgi:hypothetical protein